MDLVDEQHIAFLELGQNRRQVARPFERRALRDMHVRTHLCGDDAGQGGLAEARRTGEQQMVDAISMESSLTK